jgi:hypothetical protein
VLDFSVLENPKRDLWDSFLALNSFGDLWQTIDYGEFIKKQCPGALARTARLIAIRNGVPEGIAQGVCVAWGRIPKYLGLGTVMTVREGPILSMTSRDRPGLLKSIISAFENLGAKNRIMGIKILWPHKWGYADLFGDMGYENVGTNITYTINLDGGADVLWRHIDGNKRRNIKKALDRGVDFIESSSFEDLEKFYGLILEVAKRHKFVPSPLSWYQTLWKSQSQKDASRLFFTIWKDNNVSGVLAIIHSKTIYALGFGYNSAALEVRPNDLLHWKIMEWGCKRGFLKYHMGEVHPETDSSAGIWRWKREWNGDLDHAYIFRKLISKYGPIERIYDKLKKQE